MLAGNPGKDTLVHCWRDRKHGMSAVENGHDVIMSPFKEVYFSVPQGVEDDPFTYLAPKMRIPLSMVYSFDPCVGMTEEMKRHVLGSECCVWSECVWNEYDLAFKLWPRACAFAEALWTAPASRDFADFSRRVAVERKYLISKGVNCAPLK